MEANRYVGRESLSHDLEAVVRTLGERLVIPSTGLTVIFENVDIVWAGHVRVEPFYVARHDYLRDGPESGTPTEILFHLAQNGWSHLIWLPRWLCRSDVATLTMRYAHELAHYRQVLDPESVRRTRQFFRRMKEEGFAPELEMETRPPEFDAHRVALETFEDMHGTESLDAYISIEARDPKMAKFYRRLFELIQRMSA